MPIAEERRDELPLGGGFASAPESRRQQSLRVERAVSRIAARAADPAERLDAGRFLPRRDTVAEAQRHEAEWRRVLAGGDDRLFARVLQRTGLSPARLHQALLDVRLVPGADLPEWALELRAMLDALHDRNSPRVPPFTVSELIPVRALTRDGIDPSRAWPMHAAFEPLLAAMGTALCGWVAESHAAITPGAERSVLAHLARRWSETCGQLVQRVHAAAPAQAGAERLLLDEDMDPLDRWLALLDEYPVLGRVLAVIQRNWKDAVRELLQRLAADAALLDETFAPATPHRTLGAVVQCVAGAGDSHAGGRAVALLTFAAGITVVYKPRDLRIAEGYMALVRELGLAGGRGDDMLCTRRILARDGYGWEEGVAAAPCRTPAEVRRYYRRLGMLARLLQLTDGADVTADNVLACGEHPVLVDLEMLAAPRLRAGTPTESSLALLEEVWDSPVRCGIITAQIRGPAGQPARDVGVLATPAQRTAVIAGVGAGDAAVVGEGAVPTLEGRTVPSRSAYADVLAGYAWMSRRLRRHTAMLLGRGSVLRAMRAYSVRSVLRDTDLYVRLLRESLRPECLRDGRARALRLSRLARADMPAPLICAEIEALRDCDVPRFDALVGAGALRLPCGGALPGLFHGRPLTRMLARVRRLRQRDTREELARLRAALFVLDPDWRAPVMPTAPRRRPRADPEWDVEARRVGDAICRLAYRDRDGTPQWIGLSFRPASQSWSFGLLDDDLLTGRAGIACVLADLGERVGDASYGASARALTRHQLAMLARTDAPATRQTADFLYATRRVAQALGDTALVAAAAAAERHAEGALRHRRAADPTAASYMLLALGSRRPAVTEEATVTGVRQLATSAHSSAVARGPLALVPTTREAALLALARLGLPSDDGSLDGTRPSFERDEIRSGSMLATLELGRHRRALLDVSLACARTRADELRRGGPRQLLEGGELAITAYQIAGRDADLVVAKECATRLVRLHDAHGRWFADSLADDRHLLSAVCGMGALAHLFARLHAPAKVRSLRLWA
jgi:hypothetical protein